MALFGSEKDQIVRTNKVRTTVVRTKNIVAELQKIAKSYEVSMDTLDFNILEVQTYTRSVEENQETEWELLPEDELYQIDEELALLNPLFEIKQMYEVEIFSKNLENDVYKDFKLAIGANATKCKIYLSILANSHVKYNKHFEQELSIMIQKKKLRAGILLNVFDEMMPDVISKITAHIRVEQEVTYKKNETIRIAQGYEPTLTIDDALILHYDKKQKDIDEKTKVDYASRGFIQDVKKDEVLIEYIKPKKGKAGRDCRGKFLGPTEPQVKNEPKFSIDETIKMLETEISIQYIANENGYIAFENNTYLLKTDVEIGEISFKTTGSIVTGVDSDVSINVAEKDVLKEAIGTGMIVEVSQIDIDGNVGQNAKVTAKKASVGGQTHKTATVIADTLDINVHKGKAFGKNIHITRLEHGEVQGDTIDIGQALGGKIRGKDITLEVCASHVEATASRRLEIHKLLGSENVFTINPALQDDKQESLHKTNKEISELKKDIKNLFKEIQQQGQRIKDATASFNDVKKRLVNYKKNGIKMPASFVAQYKKFQDMQTKYKELQEEQKRKKEKLTLLTTKTASFQDKIEDARIINRDRWVGFNEIKFNLITPKVELVYKPKEGSSEKIFGVVEVEEGEYEIQALKE